MYVQGPTLASSSLRPPERSSPSVCTWALERPAGPGPFGLGICPEPFFPKLSMSQCPWFTDGLNCLSVRGLSSRVFLSPAGLSPVCLCQLRTKALCVRMSLQPSFHRQVWERTELTFTHTHTPCDSCIIQKLIGIPVSFLQILYLHNGGCCGHWFSHHICLCCWYDDSPICSVNLPAYGNVPVSGKILGFPHASLVPEVCWPPDTWQLSTVTTKCFMKEQELGLTRISATSALWDFGENDLSSPRLNFPHLYKEGCLLRPHTLSGLWCSVAWDSLKTAESKGLDLYLPQFP